MRRNALLAAVEPEHWSAAQAGGLVQKVRAGRSLLLPGDPVTHVYFPLSAVIAMAAETADGDVVDVSILGPEGALGVVEAFGSRHSHLEAAVLIPGEAARMRVGAFHDLYSASAGLRMATRRYVEMAFVESQQSIACNVLHSVERRLAKALLSLSERAGANALPVTQEALARMLGVQRTTISAAIAVLKAAGSVTSWRGGIEIRDRQALDASACSCAAVWRQASRFVQPAIEGSPGG